MPESAPSHSNRASAQPEESPWRISRIPGSVITFASFDPTTASSTVDENEAAMRKLSLNEELCRPKRIVIETSPDGRSTWRFVPKARCEEGVENEGMWPRVVDVCGKLTTLTQDQWEMYKLDRRYDCLVRLSPMPSLVRKSKTVESSEPSPKISVPEADSSTQASSREKTHLSNHVKRRRSSDLLRPEKRARNAPLEDTSTETDSESEDDEAEEDEVNELVNESGSQRQEQPKKQYQTSARLLKVRANIEEARRRRRDLAARRKAQLDAVEELKDDDIEMMSCTESPVASPSRTKKSEPSPVKRKASDGHISEPPAESSEDESNTANKRARFRSYDKKGDSKRTRTLSPDSAKRALRARRSQWWRKRYDQNRQEARTRMEEREKKQLDELFAQAAQQHEERSKAEAAERERRTKEEEAQREARKQPEASSSKASSSSTNQKAERERTPEDDDARRQALLEESRRKIAELERDRPLWEEQARKRTSAESAKAQEQAQAEAARKAKSENEARAAADKEARAKQKADAERREREDAAAETRRRRENARQTAIRDGHSWVRCGWTILAALERYKIQSEAFDKLNFFRGDVVVFETIPWPVLKRPNSFSVEDIDWNNVETFFKEISLYLTADEYAKIVEKSHKRFHPDRWRSRRVLTCVADEEEKECLEVAANTVAQAITPLWQEVTGR